MALVVGASGSATAEPVCSDTKTCLAAVEAAQQSTRSLSARFEQTKHVSLMAEPIVTGGHFSFDRPPCAAENAAAPACAATVVWKMDDPAMTIRIGPQGVELPPEVAREAGSGIKALTGALEQVGALMSGSLAGVTRLFEVEAKPSGEGVAVHLVPRHASVRDLFTAIDMHFAAPHLVLQSIGIRESLGDRLEIVFRDIRRNGAGGEQPW
ncbi:MAG TPA: outer membrane lipoprotein carrier protein LolA [Terriglobales bacterium]|nr:outer membrane lipoprotein carrier protein LolA [Terriglobales bacterium]